jgi:hypothetical protein
MTAARRDALRALQQLHAVTAEPPVSGLEADEVVDRAAEVLAARERPLRDLAAALAREPGTLRDQPEAVELYELIEQRAAAWHAALTHARHLVGERLQSVSRARAATHR